METRTASDHQRVSERRKNILTFQNLEALITCHTRIHLLTHINTLTQTHTHTHTVQQRISARKRSQIPVIFRENGSHIGNIHNRDSNHRAGVRVCARFGTRFRPAAGGGNVIRIRADRWCEVRRTVFLLFLFSVCLRARARAFMCVRLCACVRSADQRIDRSGVSEPFDRKGTKRGLHPPHVSGWGLRSSRLIWADRLSVRLSNPLSIHLSVCRSTCLFRHLPVCLLAR